MAPRSLLQLFTVVTAAAVFTETAKAAVYASPDLSNPLESRIQALRNGDWQPLLKAASQGEGPTPQEIARYWGNGGGHAWGNGGGWRNGGWRNGGGWGNGGRYYYGGGIGWPNGGWGNGGGWANVLPGGFINW